MKRGIIYNNGHTIVIPDNEIWMTAWEIADLFYVTPNSINHAVKRVLKEGVLIEFQVYRYTCLYNPQNEMFRLLGTKRSFSQNETFFFFAPLNTFYPALFRLISHFNYY